MTALLAILAALGPLGNLVSLLPWAPAKAVGHVLSALGAFDVGKVRAVVTSGQQVYKAMRPAS